jgi:hypothetical protein
MSAIWNIDVRMMKNGRTPHLIYQSLGSIMGRSGVTHGAKVCVALDLWLVGADAGALFYPPRPPNGSDSPWLASRTVLSQPHVVVRLAIGVSRVLTREETHPRLVVEQTQCEN